MSMTHTHALSSCLRALPLAMQFCPEGFNVIFGEVLGTITERT